MHRSQTNNHPRFRLTARGEATAASYPERGRRLGAIRLGVERSIAWAVSHGLHHDDWAYLTELTSSPLSLRSLGEALAIRGQTRELVSEVVDRLVHRGFVEPAPLMRGILDTVFTRASGELVAAHADLEQHRTRMQITPHADRRVVDAALREALFRHVAAQRFLDEIG